MTGTFRDITFVPTRALWTPFAAIFRGSSLRTVLLVFAMSLSNGSTVGNSRVCGAYPCVLEAQGKGGCRVSAQGREGKAGCCVFVQVQEGIGLW